MTNFKLAAILLATTFLVTMASAMPPLKGRFEPNYPPGVNQPEQRRINRDEPNLEGEWNCLVILIEFPDYRWDNQNDTNFNNENTPYTSAHYNAMLFSENEFAHPGAVSRYTGSMRDYYREISGGVFETVGVATRWYRAPENYSYYCNRDGEIGTGDDFGFGEYPNNAMGLVEDACEAADRDADFSRYDNDNDDVVDALFIVHSGPGAEEFGDAGASYIWSHKWQIPEREFDGVRISTYTMEPQNGTIGVFCHEFGHALRLPDLYDTDGSSEGVGEWCLMGGGGWNYRPGDPFGTCPAHMCGWAKARLDWVEVVNVQQEMRDVQLQPVEVEPQIYRLWTRGERGNEYFLIENRQRFGFDAGLVRRQIEYGLPAPSGLLITHIDETRRDNENDTMRWVDIEEASPVRVGNEWLENLNGDRARPADRNLFAPNRGDEGDLWPGFERISDDSTRWIGERGRTRFGRTTIPSNRSNARNLTQVEIFNIRQDGRDVIFDASVNSPDSPRLILTGVDLDDENDNRSVSPGENAMLEIELLNAGLQHASAVTASLRYEGELNITVEPDEVNFPDITPGSVATSRSRFTVTFPADAAIGDSIRLDGIAACNNNFEFPFEISIEIKQPHDWIKVGGNPVLEGTDWEEWQENLGIGSFDIMDEGDTLKIWYIQRVFMPNEVVGSAVGYAWSTNRGESWSENPEPTLTFIGSIHNGISVIMFEDGYRMCYIEFSGLLYMYGSETGLDWHPLIEEQPVLRRGRWAEEIWEQIDLTTEGDLYFLYFGGMDTLGIFSIGRVISTDLESWELEPSPFLTPSFDNARFDAEECFAPDIFQSDGTTKLTYYGIGERAGHALIMDDGHLERYVGSEVGGAVIDSAGSGARMFQGIEGNRLLYNYRGAIHLALEPGEPLSAPPSTDNGIELPSAILLGAAYPNPFNGMVTIPYQLRLGGDVSYSIYDLAGREMMRDKLGQRPAGRNRIVLDASGFSSGVYFVRLESAGDVAKGRVVLLK